jgi:hypothetical protein
VLNVIILPVQLQLHCVVVENLRVRKTRILSLLKNVLLNDADDIRDADIDA